MYCSVMGFVAIRTGPRSEAALPEVDSAPFPPQAARDSVIVSARAAERNFLNIFMEIRFLSV